MVLYTMALYIMANARNEVSYCIKLHKQNAMPISMTRAGYAASSSIREGDFFLLRNAPNA